MKIISIDFDLTIWEEDKKLILPNKVNNLFEEPFNFIVIYTARSWSQFFYIKDILDKNKIKYHAIICEKIRADVMIDDKNCGGLLW